MGSTLALDDVPDDILIEILTFTWTLAPKRMCRRISNLYDKQLSRKLFHCLVSDLHSKPMGNIPISILQFVYKADRQTFDEIVLTDLKASSETYCFDDTSFKNSVTYHMLMYREEDIMVKNKDFEFGYTNKSILSNIIFYQSDELLRYVLDLFISVIDSDIVPPDNNYYYYPTNGRNIKSDKKLTILTINALVLGNEKTARRILKLAKERDVLYPRTYTDSSCTAILSSLLIKINNISLFKKFQGMINTNDIMNASIILHRDTIFDYVFQNFFRFYEITYLLKLINQSVMHDNLHVFTFLLKQPKILQNLFTNVIIDKLYGLSQMAKLVDHINNISESKPLFVEAFGKIIRSQKVLWNSDKARAWPIPRESLLSVEKGSDIHFFVQVIGETDKESKNNPSNKFQSGSKRQTKHNPKSFQSRLPSHNNNSYQKSSHKKSRR